MGRENGYGSMGRRECLKVGLEAAWLCLYVYVCEAESKMTCWGDGSVMPQGLGLARDHCAGICSLFLLLPPIFLTPLVTLSLLASFPAPFPSDILVYLSPGVAFCFPPPTVYSLVFLLCAFA